MPSSLLSRIVIAVRHQWIVVVLVLAAGVAVAIAASHRARPTYTATTMVLMVPASGDASTSQTPTQSQPVLSTDLPSLATDTTVLSRLKRALGDNASLEVLRSRIRAKVSSESTLMPVQYTDKSADAAIRGANIVGDEITRLYREIATKRFDSLIADFSNQLARRRTELTQLDRRLTAAAKIYPYVDVGGSGGTPGGATSVYQRLIAIRTERDSLRASQMVDAVMAQAMGQLIADARPLAARDIAESDRVYRGVQDQYAKDFVQLDAMSAFGTARYPGFTELRAAVQRERQKIGEARYVALKKGLASNPVYLTAVDNQVRAKALLASDQARLNELEREETTLDKQTGRNGIATEVARIRRDHENAESSYATIANRLAKTIADRAEAASTGSVIVLDHAQFAPKSAVASPRIVGGGVLFLAIWLALTLALMIDSSEERFRDTVTIETIYGAPVIGSLV